MHWQIDLRQFLCVATGLASTALVLSIAAPFGGQNWYYLTLLSPLSGFYYWQRGTRQEEVQVRRQKEDMSD